MASSATTPATSHSRSASRTTNNNNSNNNNNNLPSRPSTPLRPRSTSLRASQTTPTAASSLGASQTSQDNPLNALEPAFSELSDSMADLEANMLHLQLLSESLTRFNENFGALLYGMNMSAFCVDFPEAPIVQSFARHASSSSSSSSINKPSPFPGAHQLGLEATFLTNDTSFVENPPPTSAKASSKFSSVPGSAASARTMGRGGARGAGGSGVAMGRGRGAGVSGIARGASTRGTAAGRTRGSGIARGVGRGRGGGTRRVT